MKKTPPVIDAAPSINRRRWLLLLWSAGLAALLWRLISAWEISRGEYAFAVFTPAKATDLATYMRLAEEVAEGKFTGAFYYQPFYYAVFLPLCRWLTGASVWGVIFFQALLGAVSAMIAGMSAALLAGRRAGVITAYLTALCTILVFYTPFHQIATLQTFNVALMTYWAIRAFQCGKLRYVTGFAFMAAVGALTRGNILLIFIPLVLAMAVIYVLKYNVKKMLSALALAVGTFIIVESPFIIYNSLQLGRLCGPSTAADAVLALGNTPEAPPGGREPGLPAGPMEYPQAYHLWMADNNVMPELIDFIVSEPAAFLELTFRKLLLFWDYREIPNNVSMTGEGATSRLLQVTVPAGVLLAVGIAGMLLMIKRLRRSSYWAVYITVIFYWGATAAFYNLSRFRAPVLPVLAVFAGIFIDEMIRRSRRNDWKFVKTYGILAAIIGVFITLGAYEFYRTMLEKYIIRLVRPQGTVLKLPDDRCVNFYHGPMTFGGWQPVEAKVNTLLEVAFPTVEKHSVLPAEVEFSVQSSRAGALVLSVAGVPVNTAFQSPEFKKITVRLPQEFKSNNIKVKVLYNSAEAFFIADHQRDYSASKVNGKVIPGELVMRITR